MQPEDITDASKSISTPETSLPEESSKPIPSSVIVETEIGTFLFYSN